MSDQLQPNKEHLFEGTPDARQAGDIRPSRFRPRYRQLSVEEKTVHDAIKDKAAELEQLFELVADGRDKALAFTALEESIMWIIKGLTGSEYGLKHVPIKVAPSNGNGE